jgi:alpha-galactosidase
VHELVEQLLLERGRTKAVYTLSLDPLTAVVCSFAEIESMFGEMWEAHRACLGEFETAKAQKVASVALRNPLMQG